MPTSLQPTVGSLSFDNPTTITHAFIKPHNCALYHCNYKASQVTGYPFLVHGSTKLPPCPLSQHRRRDHWLAGCNLDPVFLAPFTPRPTLLGRYSIRSSHTPQFPDQIVMFGGHTDSWDVGQGAQDDGAGFMVSYEALYVARP